MCSPRCTWRFLKTTNYWEESSWSCSRIARSLQRILGASALERKEKGKVGKHCIIKERNFIGLRRIPSFKVEISPIITEPAGNQSMDIASKMRISTTSMMSRSHSQWQTAENPTPTDLNSISLSRRPIG